MCSHAKYSNAQVWGLAGYPNEFTFIASTGNVFGASAMKFIPELFDEDVYVIPSSIHEVLVIPCQEIDFDRDSFNEMIQDINEYEVLEKDRLSNHAYLCKDKILQIA